MKRLEEQFVHVRRVIWLIPFRSNVPNANILEESIVANSSFRSLFNPIEKARSGIGDLGSVVRGKASEIRRQDVSHTTQDMWSDLEAYVKAHPTQALFGALFMRVIASRTLRGD